MIFIYLFIDLFIIKECPPPPCRELCKEGPLPCRELCKEGLPPCREVCKEGPPPCRELCKEGPPPCRELCKEGPHHPCLGQAELIQRRVSLLSVCQNLPNQLHLIFLHFNPVNYIFYFCTFFMFNYFNLLLFIWLLYKYKWKQFTVIFAPNKYRAKTHMRASLFSPFICPKHVYVLPCFRCSSGQNTYTCSPVFAKNVYKAAYKFDSQ